METCGGASIATPPFVVFEASNVFNSRILTEGIKHFNPRLSG
jgi:hypothetical protein